MPGVNSRWQPVGSLVSERVELPDVVELLTDAEVVGVADEASVPLLVGEASCGLSGSPVTDGEDVDPDAEFVVDNTDSEAEPIAEAEIEAVVLSGGAVAAITVDLSVSSLIV